MYYVQFSLFEFNSSYHKNVWVQFISKDEMKFEEQRNWMKLRCMLPSGWCVNDLTKFKIMNESNSTPRSMFIVDMTNKDIIDSRMRYLTDNMCA